MKKYAVIPSERFGELKHRYSVVQQVTDDKGSPVGWTLLECYLTPDKEREVEALDGEVFASADQAAQWMGQYTAEGPVVYDIAYVARSWHSLFRDYKQARERLKGMVADKGGFEALSWEERRIVAAWFAGTEQEINATLTLEERIEAGNVFDRLSRASREARYSHAFNLFRNVLSTSDAVRLIGAVMHHNLEHLYVKLGFEGRGTFNYKGDEDIPSILDFLGGTPGTVFETAGIHSIQLTPLYGMTLEDLRDRTVDIIKNGIY